MARQQTFPPLQQCYLELIEQMPPSADAPNLAQLIVLIGSIALFVIGGIISFSRIRRPGNEKLRIAAKACFWSGVTLAVAVLIWHSAKRRSWLPLDDNFEALIWLSVILGLFVMYVQRRRPIGGLDWFIMPIVILLLIAAAVFGSARPHHYVRDAWVWVHYACAFRRRGRLCDRRCCGAMFLVSNRQLRVKTAPPSQPRQPRAARARHDHGGDTRIRSVKHRGDHGVRSDFL